MMFQHVSAGPGEHLSCSAIAHIFSVSRCPGSLHAQALRSHDGRPELACPMLPRRIIAPKEEKCMQSTCGQ